MLIAVCMPGLIQRLLPDSVTTLLDGLRRIRENPDDTLSFRYPCINGYACKECMDQLDGSAVYACLSKLLPGERGLE